MRQVWKFGFRWLTVLGLAGMLMTSSGCGGGGGGGGGGDDDNTDNSVVKDTTPNTFSFTPLTNVPPGMTVTSESVTVTGIDAPTPISITGGGSYSVDGGAFTSAAGTINSGQTVAVRHTLPGTTSTTTTSILTIGGVSASFTTITAPPAGADITPAPFSFTALSGVAAGAVATSSPITVTGIDAPAPITITGGTYSINGAAYTSVPGVVTSGQIVTVRQTCSSLVNTSTTTTLTIGGVSAGFTATTAGAADNDTTPDAFSFTPQTGVPLSTLSTSNAVSITGIDAPAPISVTGGTYSINGGAFTSAAGTVTNAQTVRVQHTSSAINSTVTTTTLTIGGGAASFMTTTLAASTDATPDAYAFTPQASVPLGTVITSNPITVSGIGAPAEIMIAGGTYSINGGTYTSTPGSVSNGQTVTVRHTSAATISTLTTTTLTIGGVSAVFTSTTQAWDVYSAALYQSRCAACHRLGTIDPEGSAPDLKQPFMDPNNPLQVRFEYQTTPHHGVTLIRYEYSALNSYFFYVSSH